MKHTRPCHLAREAALAKPDIRDWPDEEEWWVPPAQEPPRESTEEDDLDPGSWWWDTGHTSEEETSWEILEAGRMRDHGEKEAGR